MANKREILLRSKVIGATLRQVRNRTGRSLKETALLIGTNAGRLSAYERGERTISLPELELFAYHMHTPLKNFTHFDPTQIPTEHDPDPKVLLSLRNRMIGALLKRHRIENNLSIRKFSKEINLPPSRISAYEKGGRSIPLVDLEKIADRLGHRIEDYFDRDGPIGTREINNNAVEMLSNLQPELREFLSNPVNEPYLRIAKKLSELDVNRLRTVAEGLLDITL